MFRYTTFNIINMVILLSIIELYLLYIRPLFEYACELCDNCGIGNSQKLEQLQLEAARIVTGLTIFTKTEIVYRETGWELLSARRKRELPCYPTVIT
jgi:hypothetical protein